ncbi:MFS transporter [Kitasatospora paranensis]|uniref:MFS transporter n=1 Tax=Kitasatospora paranensis TaxID=258053 RepID=A0ABW2FZP1_9ACTN
MPGPSAPAITETGRTRRPPALPPPAGNGRLLGAAVIDSVGSGLVVAFVLVYFARTTTLSLAAVGGALSLARLLAAPTAVCVGPLIDRWGARRTALAGNAVSAVGYAGFLCGHGVWQIVLVTWLAQVGAVTYWTSSSGLVVLAAEAAARPRWFALLHTLRNSGLAVGGALGALLVGAAGTAGLNAVMVANAASYAAAALLLARWRPVREPSAGAGVRAREPERRRVAAVRPDGGYRAVLRDRRYLLLVAVNVNFVFTALVLNLLLAVHITTGLHRPAWIAGVLLVVNGVQVAVTQTGVSRRLERFRPVRVIAASALLNAVAFGLFAAVRLTPGWCVLGGLLLGIVLYTLAETAATPFSADLSVSLAPEHLRGRYLAVHQLSWTFGQTVAPGVLTLLLTRGAGWPWLFLIALSLAAVPALLRLERLIDAPATAVDPVAADARIAR